MPPKRGKKLRKGVLACFAISLTVCGTFMLFGGSLYFSQRVHTALGGYSSSGSDGASYGSGRASSGTVVQQPALATAASKKPLSDQQHRKLVDTKPKQASGGSSTHKPTAQGPPPPAPEVPEPPVQHFKPFTDPKYRIWHHPAVDKSPRCKAAKICDGVYDCGQDGLGCIRDNLERKMKVREATAWTWKGYR